MNRKPIMLISEKRLEEIRVFKNADSSDFSVLTDDQLAHMKPSRYRNMTNYNHIKSNRFLS